MARMSRSGLPIVADTAALNQLARDLKLAGPAAYKAMQTGLRGVGELVAQDARERTSYSQRIPGSIRVRTRLANVSVLAGGESAPNAAPIENRGKGHVRHPVFGDRDVWTDKNSPPAFLSPALDDHREDAAVMVEKAVGDAVEIAIRAR